jgi:hypothetical protein
VCPPSWLPNGFPELPRPVHEIPEQLSDEVLRRGVRELALRIKTLGGIADHHFGPVERMHVQKHKDLPQVILGARAVPRVPTEAPITATGLPSQALSP